MNHYLYIQYSHFPDDTTKSQQGAATDTGINAGVKQHGDTSATVRKTGKTRVSKNADTSSVKKIHQQTAEPVSIQETGQEQQQQYPLHPPYQVLDTEAVAEYDSLEVFYADTVFAKYDTVIYRESILEGHACPVVEGMSQRSQNSQPNWIFILLLIVTFALVKLIRGFYGSIQEILVASVNKIRLNLQLRQNNFAKPQVETITVLLYTSVLAMPVFLLMNEYGTAFVNTGILNYLIVWMSMFLFVLLKIGIMRLLGNVFNCNISTAAYIANTDIYNVLSTAVLIPMVLTACYSNLPVMNMIYVMGIFAAAMFVFRLLRGTVLIFAESQISKLYLFYYAVVVEIVPLLILGKILLIL